MELNNLTENSVLKWGGMVVIRFNSGIRQRRKAPAKHAEKESLGSCPTGTRKQGGGSANERKEQEDGTRKVKILSRAASWDRGGRGERRPWEKIWGGEGVSV